MDFDFIKGKKVAELREIAAVLKIEGAEKMKKSEIIAILSKMHQEAEEAKTAEENASADIPAEKEGAETVKEVSTEAKEEKSQENAEEKPKKKRGRPRKNQTVKEEKAEEKTEEAASEEKTQEEVKTETASAEEPQKAENAGPVQENTEVKAENSEEKAEQTEIKAETKEQKPEPQKDNRIEKTGILELAEGGFGFLRFDNFLTSPEDVYVSPTQIRRFNLKTGDEICGIVRKPGENERFGAILYVKTVNGDEPGAAIRRPDFSDLTPTYPEERIVLEKGSSTPAMRLTDLIAPIGKGQRGLIVAPPKAGKTTLLKQIAKAIESQDTGAELIVLLVDERPEEVTDMQESIKGKVIYSTFDEQPQHHVKVAEMVLARAERLCEQGKDVIILLDSITRLARAYNLVEPSSGRTLSGGLDPAALYKPKKFFGAARNTREGGSITILATALVETGSRMDDVIFEEFKGTGNMELHLDRKLQERRIFPAINLNKSGTRREDVLMSPKELEAVWYMRRALSDMGNADAAERIILDLIHTKTNADFIQRFLKTRF